MQLPDAEDPADMQWLRRMVFTSNRNLTQSEAYLIPAAATQSAQVCLFHSCSQDNDLLLSAESRRVSYQAAGQHMCMHLYVHTTESQWLQTCSLRCWLAAQYHDHNHSNKAMFDVLQTAGKGQGI